MKGEVSAYLKLSSEIAFLVNHFIPLKWLLGDLCNTLPETNTASKKQWLEDDPFLLGPCQFSGATATLVTLRNHTRWTVKSQANPFRAAAGFGRWKWLRFNKITPFFLFEKEITSENSKWSIFVRPGMVRLTMVLLFDQHNCDFENSMFKYSFGESFQFHSHGKISPKWSSPNYYFRNFMPWNSGCLIGFPFQFHVPTAVP